MRVLIVYPEVYAYGGAELLIVRLANHMTKRGIGNAVLTTSVLPEMARDLIGTELVVLGKPPARSFYLEKLGEIRTLYRGVRDVIRDFDLINVHNYPAELTMFLCHKPAVWMCNEPLLYLNLDIYSSPIANMAIRTLLTLEKFVVKRYVKNVVVADEFNAERFERIYGFRPEVINYGIDHEFFSVGDAKRASDEFDLSGNFVVLQAGMLTPFKNQMESVKAMERVRDRIPNVKLVLAGWWEEKYRVMLERYVQERNLERNVVFTGHLAREGVRDLYHACDLLLHPIKPLGGWLAPFEALCAKMPIVVSTGTPTSRIIRREKIGIVTDAFVDSILDIYNNRQKYDKMIERGAAWVRDNLSWDTFCEKMVKVFYRAMGKQGDV